MSRAKVVLWALPPVLAAIALSFGWGIHAELAQGRPVFWLAELWTPAAVMTIVVAVCVDFVASAPPSPPSRTRARRGRRGKRPASRS